MLLHFREALQPAQGCTSLPVELQEVAIPAASMEHAPTQAVVLEGSSRKQTQDVCEVCHTSPQCGSLQRRLPRPEINKTQSKGE